MMISALFSGSRRMSAELMERRGKALEAVKKYEDEWLQVFLETGVAFVHVPRAAGTAFELSLFCAEGEGYPGRQFMTAKRIRERVGFGNFETLYKIGIVRNPFVRLVSSYAYLTRRREGQVDYEDAVAMKFLRKFKGFAEFVEFLYKLHKSEKSLWRSMNWPLLPDKEDDKFVPVHFWPQHVFLLDDDEEVLADVVLAQEDLKFGLSLLCSGEADPSGLRREILLPSELPRVNCCRVDHGTSDDIVSPVSLDEEMEEINCDWDLGAYYNPRLLKMVGEIYDKDFYFFGYERDNLPWYSTHDESLPAPPLLRFSEKEKEECSIM